MFGLVAGMSVTTLAPYIERPLDNMNGAYRLKTVPDQSDNFRSYIVSIAPKAGLFSGMAFGEYIATNPNGHELKTAFSKMRNELNSILGHSTTENFLSPESIWTEPNEFIQSLAMEERTLSATWDLFESNNSSGLSSVYLSANANDDGEGYLTVSFTFINFSDARRELE